MGCPNSIRDAISGLEAGRRARLLPDRRQPGAEAADRGRSRSKSKGIIVDAASGVSGAGRAASAGTHFCAVDGSFRAYGLTNHRHTAEMEMTTGAEVLFTPHLMAASRGILATCYARATGPLRPAGDPPRRLCRRALRPCRRDSARDQMGDRVQRRLPLRPLRRAHRHGRRARRDRQSRQGRGGTDDPVRQSDARPRRGRGPFHHGSLSVSVTLAEGFVASGLACRDQGRADAATSACWRPTTASRCRPPPCSPRTSSARRRSKPASSGSTYRAATHRA